MKNRHVGQMVVAAELENEVQFLFERALQMEYPIASMVPLGHPRFVENGICSDRLSMAANNTSSFCYRTIGQSRRLSRHALGRAIDINPLWNPCIHADGSMEPDNARQEMDHPGVLSASHPLVQLFLSHGWIWGGNWQNPRDFHHFEKPDTN